MWGGRSKGSGGPGSRLLSSPTTSSCVTLGESHHLSNLICKMGLIEWF